MFLFSQLTSQLISLAAIGVYLAAAFLPCEPTSEERSALAGALAGGAVHAAVLSPPVPPPVQSEAYDLGAHDHAAHGHVGHGEVAASNRSSANAHAAEGMPVRLALKAKCVCGCDRTRSQVGGGAARLGSVVLSAFVTGLPPASVVIPEDRVLTRWVEVHFEDDLVPI